MNESRSILRKLSAVGVGALLGGVATFLTFLFTYVGPDSRQTQLESEKLERELVKDIQANLGGDPRRMIPETINRISSSCLRSELRKRIVWTLLEDHIRVPAEPSVLPPFRFDSEESDWHLLGEIVLALRDDDTCTGDFRRWWHENVKTHLITFRWPQHAGELWKLFSWVEGTYLGGPVPPLEQPVTTVQKGWEASLILSTYSVILGVLMVLVLHRLVLWWRYQSFTAPSVHLEDANGIAFHILLQLPIYNEKYVAERVISRAVELDWPRDKLQIQVLDDSTDKTSETIAKVVADLQARGIDVTHIRRSERSGFKAGALANGLAQAREADLVCIFDADFIPHSDFLRRATVHFSDPSVGMVQTRWEHNNERHSFLTRLQAVLLDGHFVIDHGARHRSGCFFNFNGTAGIWRRHAIEESGGWQGDTLTEDLDLSYRAQLKGWRFVYRPDIVAPSELPTNILSFKAQQRRWTCGSMQTAQKLLKRVWQSGASLRQKIEATAHLLSNTSYLAALLAGILMPLAHRYEQLRAGYVFDLELALLITGMVSIGLYYWTAGRYVQRRRTTTCLLCLPVFLLGMGLSVSNGAALIGSLFRKRWQFERTPKYGTENSWRRAHYRVRHPMLFLLIELMFVSYIDWAVMQIWERLDPTILSDWRAMAFPIFYLVGTGSVVLSTCVGLLLQVRIVEQDR